jgi:hypothetical protein
MDLSSGDIASMIFKPADPLDRGDFSLNRQTLNVYLNLNGEVTLGELSAKLDIDLDTLRGVISHLLRLGLIESADREIVAVDAEFLRDLINQLALATGPIASILIEDEIQNLGYEVDQFPGHRAMKLIERLAAQIRRDDKKSIFLKNMITKIRQKGYPTFFRSE